MSEVTATRMKTLDDVKFDLSSLYDEFRAGGVDRVDAAELANITGKFLKAHALQLAERAFEETLSRRLGAR